MSAQKNTNRSAEAGAPLLRVDGLTVAAGGGTGTTELVRGISFEISAGERVGLIGESGSGKSLTALAIAGLLPDGLSAGGSAVLDGVETVGASEAALRPLRGPAIGFVFQEPLTALDPLMRVGRQIAEPLRRHRGLRGAELDRAVAESLAEVRLEDPRTARAYPHELSGGQRQRIAIAIALAARPKLLVADEPTTALDVTVQAEVLGLLDRLVVERGMGLLFISHDLAVVAQQTSRVLVLRDGEAVERGAVVDLVRAPQHPYTAQLVAHARALDAALDGAAADGADGTVGDAQAGGDA